MDTHDIANQQKINDLIYRKPSNVIRISIDALREHLERDDFIVDMMTFGNTETNENGDTICTGCLAACAIEKMADIRFEPADIRNVFARAIATKISQGLLIGVESAVNNLRRGKLIPLYKLCGLTDAEWTPLPVTIEYSYDEIDIFHTKYSQVEREDDVDTATGYQLGIEKLERVAEVLEAEGF